ncbi:2,3-diketo-L-gulonate TRAP transporter small permease protein YiaM [subsurface metagenome]
MEKITTVLNAFLKHILVILMAAMVFIVSANVFTRYVFSFSLTWSSELSRYLMLWAAFIGASVLVNQDAHMKMDLLERFLKKGLWRVHRIIIITGSLVFFLIQTVFGCMLVIKTQGQIAASIRFLPMCVVYSVLPISGLLMIFGIAQQSCKLIREWR